MGTCQYDVIVVGASFARLAVARELRGEILLIDRHEVGSHQTSACGTPLWVPETLGVVDSVLQVHRRVVVHAPSRTVTFDVTDTPYCTFDYGKFCRGPLDQCRVRLLCATVTGRAESVVQWLFPTGRGSLVGLGSYRGATKLMGALTQFVDDLAAAPGAYHGTYFPSGLGEVTAGRMFVVGDAAGHCLPLTAEGIPPALHFGQECGQLVQRVVDGAMTALAARPRIMSRWWPRYSRFARPPAASGWPFRIRRDSSPVRTRMAGRGSGAEADRAAARGGAAGPKSVETPNRSRVEEEEPWRKTRCAA